MKRKINYLGFVFRNYNNFTAFQQFNQILKVGDLPLCNAVGRHQI